MKTNSEIVEEHKVLIEGLSEDGETIMELLAQANAALR